MPRPIRITYLCALLLGAPAAAAAQAKCEELTWERRGWGLFSPSGVVVSADRRIPLGATGAGAVRVPWADDQSRSLANSFRSRARSATILESLAVGLAGAALVSSVTSSSDGDRTFGFIISASVIEVVGLSLRGSGIRRIRAAVDHHNTACP